MKITFGMALEGVRPLGTEPSFDRLMCGVQGLTRVLELRLGPATPEVSDAQRIQVYRAALLRAAQMEEHFFSRCLEYDKFATAETRRSAQFLQSRVPLGHRRKHIHSSTEF